MIYLDNAATTKIAPEVLTAMLPYLSEQYGNAGTIYDLGRKARGAVNRARQQVAELFNCSPENIIFTSGGTEANNLAIFGTSQYLVEHGTTQIISSKVEHDSIMHTLQALSAENKMFIKGSFDVRFLDVDRNCRVQINELEKCISDKTGLVSIMYVNNETGAQNPVDRIGELCRQKGILFHVDSVQAAGFQNIDISKINCDFMSISSHKIHGPKGIGALYVREKNTVRPIIYGGSEQEFGLRGGTENIANIVGFGKACEIAKYRLQENRKDIESVVSTFTDALNSYATKYGLADTIKINLLENPTKIISICVKNCDAQTLLLMLDNQGICVSAGSACRSSLNEPSHVLMAMGLSSDDARSTIRVSFSSFNTTYESTLAAKKIVDCVKTLKMI